MKLLPLGAGLFYTDKWTDGPTEEQTDKQT
jgi:hypothetical protein